MVARVGWIRADITTLAVDVVVNAANSALAGGGGVDGAIHAAAGRRAMREALADYDGCPTGSAVITPGFDLPARFVVHAVGPIWHGGTHDEARLLAGAYAAALDLADEAGARTVAMAALSCGVYGYPIDEAMAEAVEVVEGWIAEHPQSSVELIAWAVIDPAVGEALDDALGPQLPSVP